MNVCLNPFESHTYQTRSEAVQFCPEPHCSYLIEDALFGQWRISKLVRSSTVADLYYALPQNALQDPMLVKVVHRCASDALTCLEYLGMVQHPHIFPIHSIGEVEQKHLIYFLSRYQESGSLARYTNTGTCFSLNTIFRIIEQTASALQFAHSLHLVHGYVKPENLLIVGKKQIQVSDFYHALQLKDTPSRPSVYLAPEQMQGYIVPATDQYALAMIACQLFYSFLHPWMGHAPSSQVPFTFPSIEEALSPLPIPMQQVFRRALAIEPGERFNKILDFAFELQKSIGLPGYSNQLVSPGASIPISLPGISPLPPSLPEVQKHANIVNSQAFYPTRALSLCKLPGHTAPISLLRWAQDGTHLASVSGDKHIRLWQLQQKIGTPEKMLTSQEGNITALDWSPDSHYLAAATEQGSIRIWEMAPSPKPIASWWGHDGPILALGWSPNGTKLATGGKDRSIRTWDHKGRLIASWQAHGRGGVTALAWSPGGEILASGGSDHLITLWDTTTGTQVGGFSGHSDEIRKLSWSPDGRWLSSCAGKKDPIIYLWDPATHCKLASLSSQTGEIAGIYWSEDSRWMVTASTDRTLCCWDLEKSPVTLLGQPILLDDEPLIMEGASGKHTIAIGTASMLILILQLA